MLGLDYLLMINAETLLFIDDQQTHLFKFNILRQESMCPHNDVNCSFFQISYRLSAFLFRHKSAHFPQSYGKALQAITQVLIMLLAEDRCRGEQDCLQSVRHSFKHGTES